MAFQLIWSPSARLDVKDLCLFIQQRDALAARRFAGRMFDAVERLADFPTSGRVVPEFGDPTIREVICRPCRVVYRIRELTKSVEILRVWYAARGVPEL